MLRCVGAYRTSPATARARQTATLRIVAGAWSAAAPPVKGFTRLDEAGITLLLVLDDPAAAAAAAAAGPPIADDAGDGRANDDAGSAA